MDTTKSVAEIVRRAETNYLAGNTTFSKHVTKSMYEDLSTIDAYINSKHVSGPTDSMGREKPFFNIVTSARNIWYRATDIDRRQIKFRAKKAKDAIKAFLATIHVQDWMREEGFGEFLNEWGLSLATYGSSLVKFVERDGRLIPCVENWNDMIVDPIDADDNPIIKVLNLTPAQLRKNKAYDQEMVKKLISAVQARQLVDKQRQDNRSNYIKLYEIHGEMEKSLLTGDPKDDDTFVQQMHVVSFIASKENGKYDDFCLYSGREENPYMLTHLIEIEGQTLSIGAVQNLFESQWMVNHSALSIKNQLDLASKLFFQTADESFVGQNAINSIETGDILRHKINMPLTQVNNVSHDISSLQSMQNSWKQLGNEINGISEAMLGINPPSGSAWRQTEALLNESYSLFELMQENKGLYVEEMMRKFVIPHIRKTKLSSNREIAATLDDNDITKIDSMYVKSQATRRTNSEIVRKAIAGEIVTPQQQGDMMAANMASSKESLSSLGGQRFFAPDEVDWKAEFDGFDWSGIEIDVTGEQVDRDAVTTLNTLLVTIAKNPNVLSDPNTRMIVNKILMKSGEVSPFEISTPAPQAAAPVQQTS